MQFNKNQVQIVRIKILSGTPPPFILLLFFKFTLQVTAGMPLPKEYTEEVILSSLAVVSVDQLTVVVTRHYRSVHVWIASVCHFCS